MRFGYLGASVLLLLLITSCSTKLSETLVAKYGNDEVTLGEFEKAYLKSAGDIDQAKNDSLDKYADFLDLYVKYKMKLADADKKGYNAREDLNKEYVDYKKTVGKQLILENRIKVPGTKKLYEERKIEFRASHILIRQDTITAEKAEEKAKMVLDKLQNGADWNDMLQQYSDDQYSKKIGGDIYYMRAGTIDQEIEEAALKTPVDSIYPGFIKSRFGYHILKVTDKKPGRYMINLAHILIGFTDKEGKVDKEAAKVKADSLVQVLRDGGSFAELAKKFSDDPGSKDKAGDLGYSERRRYIREFEEPGYKLKVGEVSDPVETRFGYHIIKCLGEKPYPKFDEVKEQLRKQYEKLRYQNDLNIYIDSLKTVYQFTVNEDLINEVDEVNDSVKFNSLYFNTPLKDSLGDKTVVTIANKNIALDSLISVANENRDVIGKLINSENINIAMPEFSEGLVLDEAALKLDQSDQNFADLMDDYKSGIYIFKLLEDEVWNKIVVDSSNVYNYFEENKDKYKFPERISYTQIYSTQESEINNLYESLKNGAEFDSLAYRYKKPGNRSDELVTSDFNKIAAAANQLKIGEYTSPVKADKGWVIARLDKRVAPKLKTFEEARAEVSGDLQEKESKRLNKEYDEYLDMTFHPEYFYENLENAFKGS